MARPRKHDGTLYQRGDSKIWWMWYRDRDGKRRFESTFTEDWDQAQKRLRERLQARDENILEILRQGEKLLFNNWADFFLENFSRPPLRASKTHEANFKRFEASEARFWKPEARGNVSRPGRGLPALATPAAKVRPYPFGISGPGQPETGNGTSGTPGSAADPERGGQEAADSSQSMLDAEFPVTVRSLFRPHYVTWSEQQRAESPAPQYLRNVIRIITETGLRIYKELAPMRKDQVDVANRVAWVPDSKTPNGVAEVPLTEMALGAFRDQIAISDTGPWLFPSEDNPEGHQKSFKTAWRATLRRAGVPYFRIYDLRSTYATRLSAGGVADEWVTQLLRQGDSKVFKKYPQMKLQMKREAHVKLNRQANELEMSSVTAQTN